MNYLISFFQVACFLSAVIPLAICETPADMEIDSENESDSENSIDYHQKPWFQMESKLYIHTKDHPQGIKFHSRRGTRAIKKNAETKIITHGYQGTKNDLQNIVEEYLKKKEDANVLTFDWKNVARGSPLQAAMGAVSLGFVLAYHIIELMQEHDIKPEQIHLIGYNMGAHLMGTAGRYQFKTLGRITGLDPSKDFFNKTSALRLPALNKRNAKFVDVLHTNAGGVGINEVIGTADFFPNGGKAQPVCDKSTNEYCNAATSMEYFAESIQIEDSFIGSACRNYQDYLKNWCKLRAKAIFGEYGSTQKAGVYFFQTNDKYPFGRKKLGEHPTKEE